ncbi:terminase small subunit [Xanthobacter agilis]|uniref:terminase small subunit n=1 Tax=Xanthobacter agilis TaxID=47492 RepID=UPI00372711B1
MTPKQELFVIEYMKDLNASAAAERAGYSAKTAYAQGQRLLKNAEVSAKLCVAMEKRAQREEITADRVLREIAKVAFFDPREAFNGDGTLKPIHELSAAVASAIAGLDVTEFHDADGAPVGRLKKVKLSDRVRALELLARHLGMLNDKLTLKGDAENPLTLLVKAIQGNTIRPVPTTALPKPGGDD